MPTATIPVQVIQPLQLTGDGPFVLHDPLFDWHLLAEGDSWFTIAAIPSSNLLLELRLAKSAQVFNLAYPGDTLKHMAAIAHNYDLQRYLAKRNFNYQWDALLLSGGGNDIIDSVSSLVRAQAPAGSDPARPESYVDLAQLDALLVALQADYASIVALRDSADSLSQGAPIFVHTYAYPTPRNAPATFLFAPVRGPWFYPVLKNSGLGEALQMGIAEVVIDRLADALLALDSQSGRVEALPAFHVVDTRTALVRAAFGATGPSGDWLNEIHPNHDGYRKLAGRLATALNAALT
ncbi:MAG TPA: hypothetical protein VGQ23_18835 [Burkholderiaceae bacterium]|nr:hypothetical protein [Burkholderiaceae bacterium]